VHIPRDRIGHTISDILIPKPGGAPIEHEIVIDPEFVCASRPGRRTKKH
jgi:hypothetical protein